MLFEVERASISDGDLKPCKEAKKRSILHIDYRVSVSPEAFTAKTKEDWFASGTNHKVTATGIQRDMGYYDKWTVELDSLEQLITMKNKYGDLIIGNSWFNNDIPRITIYDDYIE